MDKLIRISRFLDLVLKIAWIVLCVSVAIGVCFCTVMVCAPSFTASLNRNAPKLFTFETGSVTVWFHDLSANQYRAIGLVWALGIVAVFVLVGVMIHLLKSITHDMSRGHPFSTNVPRRIRQIATVIFVYAFVFPLSPLVQTYAISKILDLQQVFSTSPIVDKVDVGFGYNVDVSLVFVALIVVLLSYVFEYGARLQQESDETL